MNAAVYSAARNRRVSTISRPSLAELDNSNWQRRHSSVSTERVVSRVSRRSGYITEESEDDVLTPTSGELFARAIEVVRAYANCARAADHWECCQISDLLYNNCLETCVVCCVQVSWLKSA
ncbi:hypothetical protein ACHWQZ_G000177 [Mnemiopsis leidyi]